jgi:hypothetical protein
VKKILSFILLLLVVNSIFAQKQKVKYITTFDDKLVHFGFTLGLNYMDFRVINYNPIGENPDFQPDPSDGVESSSLIRSDVAAIVPGFTVGIVTSLRLTQDLNLRFLPGMSFGERNLTYNVPVIDINNYGDLPYYSIKSTYLDFPLLLKYKARRINNGRPYVIFGPAFRQDISRTGKDDLVKLKKGGFYAEVGAGWDYYFPFFRLSMEAKFSFGLKNQLGDLPGDTQLPYYAQSIKHMRSNIFTLLFHFE